MPRLSNHLVSFLAHQIGNDEVLRSSKKYHWKRSGILEGVEQWTTAFIVRKVKFDETLPQSNKERKAVG